MTGSTRAYIPRRLQSSDIGNEEAFLTAIDEIKYFNDGDIVDGVIVKVDRDEVLPRHRLQDRRCHPEPRALHPSDVDPNEVVAVGDRSRSPGSQKEGQGRPPDPVKRAPSTKACLGPDREDPRKKDGIVTGTVIEVVKGGLILDIGLRGFLPASHSSRCVVSATSGLTWARSSRPRSSRLDKNRNNVVPVPPCLARAEPSPRFARRSLTTLQKGQVRSGRRFLDRQLRCLRGPGWRRRSRPRLRALLEAHRPPVRGCRGRPGVTIGSIDMDAARLPVAEERRRRPVAAVHARTHQIGQVVG